MRIWDNNDKIKKNEKPNIYITKIKKKKRILWFGDFFFRIFWVILNLVLILYFEANEKR